jgi:hypothetical protein
MLVYGLLLVRELWQIQRSNWICLHFSLFLSFVQAKESRRRTVIGETLLKNKEITFL